MKTLSPGIVKLSQGWAGEMSPVATNGYIRCSEWSFLNIYITDIFLLSPHVATTWPSLLSVTSHFGFHDQLVKIRSRSLIVELDLQTSIINMR